MAAAGMSHEDTIMVGDSSVDIETARNAGVRSCGVTYGFQPETLALVPARYTGGSVGAARRSDRPGAAVKADCIFCRISRGDLATDIIDETAGTLTFLDHSPVFPGHLLIIPREHVDTLLDLPDDRVAPFFKEVQRASKAVEAALGAEGSFVAINNKVSQMADAGMRHEDTIMVGDSSLDIETARNAGVRSCGVTYGFQPETLALFPPDILVDRLEQLADRIVPEQP